MCVCGAITLLIVLLYCMSVMTTEHFISLDLTNDPYEKFVGGETTFMEKLYRPLWMFIGMETLTIAGKNIPNVSDICELLLLL